MHALIRNFEDVADLEDRADLVVQSQLFFSTVMVEGVTVSPAKWSRSSLRAGGASFVFSRRRKVALMRATTSRTSKGLVM